MTHRDPVIKRAADLLGGITKLSLALGRSRGAASQWARIPSHLVIEVERLTGIDRSKIRPDLHPPRKTAVGR